MRNFDEKRVEYLKKKAEIGILNERHAEVLEKQQDLSEWIQACEIYNEELALKIDQTEDLRQTSVKTLMKKIKNTEELISLVAVDMKRTDYQRKIPEDLEAFWKLGQSEKPEDKEIYDEAINKMGIMLISMGYPIRDKQDYSKPLEDYIETLNLYRTQSAEYDDMVANQFVSEDLETLCMLIGGTDEKTLKLKDRVKDIVGGEVMLNDMLAAYSSYQEALDADKQSQREKAIIEETRRSFNDEWAKAKKAGETTREELLGNPVFVQYKEGEKEIERLETAIAEKRVSDVFEVPDTFTKLNKLPKDKKAQAEKIINQKIAEFRPEDGIKPVTSVEEYYETVEKAENARKELAALKESKVSGFSEDVDEILKIKSMPEITSKFVPLTRAIDAYEKQLSLSDEAFKKLKEIEVKENPIPETFTDLAKLKPRDAKKNPGAEITYNATIKYINALIAKANPKTGVDNVEDYFAMVSKLEELEQECSGLKKRSADSLSVEDIARMNNLLKSLPGKKKEIANIKAAIKSTWVSDNAEKKKRHDKSAVSRATAEYDNAKKRLEESRAMLKYEIAKSNVVIRKELEAAIEKKNSEIESLDREAKVRKKFIKIAVMGNARDKVGKQIEDLESELEKLKSKQKKDKKAFDDVIDNFFTSRKALIDKAEKENAEKEKLSQKTLKERKTAFDASAKEPLKRIKAENSMQKTEEKKFKGIKLAEESLKITKQELDKKKENLTGLIRGYNERMESAMKKSVDTKGLDKHFTENHDAYVNSTIMEFASKRKSSAKKAYMFSVVKYKSLSAALKVMDFSTNKLLTTVLATGHSLIKADAIQARKDLKETVTHTEMLCEISSYTNASMYRQMQEYSATSDSGIAKKVVRKKATLDDDAASIKEFTAAMMKCAAKVTELEQAEGGRIEEFNQSVISTKEKSKAVDPKVREKTDALRREIITEISGADSINAKVAEAEESLNRKAEADLLEMEEAEKAQLKEKMDSINSFSDSFGKLCTPDNMGKLDTVLNVVLKITNFAIEKINGESASDEKREPLTKEGLLESLKQSIESIPDLKEKKPEEYTLEQVIKLMPALYEKVNGIREYLETMVNNAEKDMEVKSRYSEMCLEEYDSCAQYMKDIDASKESPVEGNLLDIRKKKLQDDIDATNTGAEDEIKLYRDAKEKLVEKKHEYKTRSEEISTLPDEIATAKTEEEKLRQESIDIFAETLREKRREPVTERKLSVDDVLNEDMSGWEFLSKLTGAEINSQMTLPDVVRAFEKVYINGINAVSYFDLDEDVEKAYLEDAKNERSGIVLSKSAKSEEVIEKIRINGLALKAGLMYVATNDEEKRKSYSHSPLAGQMIGVEDDNMHLCAVEFTDSSLEHYNPNLKEPIAPKLNEIPKLSFGSKRQALEEQNRQMTEEYERKMEEFRRNTETFEKKKSIIQYNRNAKGVYAEFNEMRDTVADMEHQKKLSREKDKEKDLSKEASLGKAILQSRGL